jgi:hypothetical protein
MSPIFLRYAASSDSPSFLFFLPTSRSTDRWVPCLCRFLTQNSLFVLIYFCAPHKLPFGLAPKFNPLPSFFFILFVPKKFQGNKNVFVSIFDDNKTKIEKAKKNRQRSGALINGRGFI